jgi:hypothetical protein
MSIRLMSQVWEDTRVTNPRERLREIEASPRELQSI